MQACGLIEFLVLGHESAKSDRCVFTNLDSHDGDFIFSGHLFDQGIGDLARAGNFLFIREHKHRVLHIVIVLKVALWLETHKSHSNLVKLFDGSDFLLSQLNFLIADWVISTDLLAVKRLLSFITDEALSRSKLLVIDSIDLLNVWFLCGNDCTEKAEADC